MQFVNIFIFSQQWYLIFSDFFIENYCHTTVQNKKYFYSTSSPPLKMSSSEVNKVQQRVKYVINSPAYCSTATRHGMWGFCHRIKPK